VYLPRCTETDEAGAPSPDASLDTDLAKHGETVLVVDDEQTVRMLITDVLEELGYVSIEAEDGKAGLQILESKRHIDLLITDVGLPGGMNGRQLADAGGQLRPDLKILFITGYAENAVIGDGHLKRGMHVLTKPFAMETLASRVTSILNAE
jgi:CheY-like chemotaxis protein